MNKTTNIKTEKQLVPELRFKEFDDDWIITKVLDFAPLQRGFDLPVAQIQEGPYPVVFSNGALKTHSEFKAKAPGVVTGRSGTIGKVTFVNKDYWPHNTALWVTNFYDNDPKYVYYFYINIKLDRYGTGSGVPTLNRNDVHAQKRAIPSLPEQQKIASFLSAVDEKIHKLTKKKELLEQYKKGVMQQLFSGWLRFKDENGNDYPDWEEKRLSEVLDLFHGYQFRSTDFVTSGLAIIKISNVIGSQLNLEGVSFIEDTRYEEFERFEIKKGDILMSLTGNIGRVIEVGELPFKVIQNYRVGKFIPYDLDCLSREFTKHLLMSDAVFGRFGQLSNQSAQANFGKQDMDKIHVAIPSIEEQQKIATYLSSIDTKIECVNNQITQAQTFKKGLLQQMFVAA